VVFDAFGIIFGVGGIDADGDKEVDDDLMSVS
jgi:hypothetical protein